MRQHIASGVPRLASRDPAGVRRWAMVPPWRRRVGPALPGESERRLRGACLIPALPLAGEPGMRHSRHCGDAAFAYLEAPELQIIVSTRRKCLIARLLPDGTGDLQHRAPRGA